MRFLLSASGDFMSNIGGNIMLIIVVGFFFFTMEQRAKHKRK